MEWVRVQSARVHYRRYISPDSSHPFIPLNLHSWYEWNPPHVKYLDHDGSGMGLIVGVLLTIVFHDTLLPRAIGVV